jgi:hypothetical protein
MKGALKKTDVENFPKPPKGALRDLDCPEILPPDAQEIPMGCPTPEITEDPFLEEANPEDMDQVDPSEQPGEQPGEQGEQVDEQAANSDDTVSASGARGDNRDNGGDERRADKKNNDD